jgi:acyl-CoA thioester hydrolase
VSAAAPPFPVELALPVQWGEMDAMGHVNNAVYFRWFESARIVYFERLGWLAIQQESGNGPILHSTNARFRAPLTFPDTVTVGARVSDLQADRFTMEYEVRSGRLGGAVAASGTGLIVAYDYRSLAKAPLPREIASRILELEGSRLAGGAR